MASALAALCAVLALWTWLRPDAPAPPQAENSATLARTAVAPPLPISESEPSARASAPARRALAAAQQAPNLALVFTAFTEWTARYLAASPDERAALLDEGVALARTRRGFM